MNPFKRLLVSLAPIATLLLLFPTHSIAGGIICEHVQPDLFSVDGLGDDWQSFSSSSKKFGSGSEGSMEMNCAYDDKNLYVFLNVLDKRITRTKRAAAKRDDRVTLSIGVRASSPIVATLFPGSKRVKRKLVGPRYVTIEDSLQEQGFSVEIGIPLRKISNWSPTVPYLDAKLLFHNLKPGKGKATAGLSGKMHFSDAVSSYRAFMRQAGLRNRDLRLDKLADVDAGKGPERILIGGTVLGVLGTSYTYTELPIANAKDLRKARVVKFDRSGRSAIVTELRQYGNGGSRDVVVVWTVTGNGSIQPILTFEIRKELGESLLENSWSLVQRGKYREGKKERGFDILVLAGEATGFTESSYREAPATDAKPILTPWGPQQSAVYYFEGTQVYGGEAGIKLPKKRK